MRSALKTICATLFLAVACSAAAGQSGGNTEAKAGGGDGAPPEVAPRVWVHLPDGRRMEVDEVTESADGIWYRRGSLTTYLARAQMLRVEHETSADLTPGPPPDASRSPVLWRLSDAARVEKFFSDKFKRPLPVTAFGQSELHRRWGFDHRNSLDVGVHPDSPEGRALIKFLRAEAIPFLTFRSAVPGVASGPHVHIGRPSPRIATP